MKFSYPAAKSLAAGQHLLVEGCDGLRLVASKSTRAWTYRYKGSDGRMKQVRLGLYPEMSVAKAVVAWEEARSARQSGADPAESRRRSRAIAAAETAAPAPSAAMTVEQVAIWFAESVMPKRFKLTKPARDFRLKIQAALTPSPISKLRPSELTRNQAYAFIESISDKPVSARMFKGRLAMAWDAALDAGMIPDDAQNWWRMVHRNNLQSKGKIVGGQHIGPSARVLSEEEVGLTLADLYLRKITSETLRDALTLYLWTGCRGAEIVQMRGDEMREEDGVLWWTLPKGKTKVAKHRLAFDLTVPLFGRAREVVERRMALLGDGHLFPPSRGAARRRTHMKQDMLAGSLCMHQPESKIKPHIVRGRFTVAGWSAHDLRRTVRTHWAAMGCPDRLAEHMLGHVDSSIEGVYNRHGYRAERVEWLRRLDQRWEAAFASVVEKHGPFRPWSRQDADEIA